MIAITLALALLGTPGCAEHELPQQRQDAASVRRADSAWSAAYAHGDTTFLRCLLTPDYHGFNVNSVEVDRDGEVAKAAHYGSPDKPLPAFPKADVEMHGTSAWVGGVVNGKRWIDIYRFENGAWHAFLSIDQKLPPTS